MSCLSNEISAPDKIFFLLISFKKILNCVCRRRSVYAKVQNSWWECCLLKRWLRMKLFGFKGMKSSPCAQDTLIAWSLLAISGILQGYAHFIVTIESLRLMRFWILSLKRWRMLWYRKVWLDLFFFSSCLQPEERDLEEFNRALLLHDIVCLGFSDKQTICRPLSEPWKPLKAFILDEEPIEPLKCLFGPLSAFISTFEPLFSAFCPQNAHYLGFGVHFYREKVF